MMHSTLSATNLNGYDIATVLKPPSHLKKTVCSYEQMGRGDKRAVLILLLLKLDGIGLQGAGNMASADDPHFGEILAIE